jgi:hypothetical protein
VHAAAAAAATAAYQLHESFLVFRHSSQATSSQIQHYKHTLICGCSHVQAWQGLQMHADFTKQQHEVQVLLLLLMLLLPMLLLLLLLLPLLLLLTCPGTAGSTSPYLWT